MNDKETQQIIDKYRYDLNITKYSNKHFFNDHVLFGKIKSRGDIEQTNKYVKNTILYYQKVYPLVSDDIIELEKALGKYQLAVKKVIQCNDTLFNYSSNELQQLIDNIFEYDNLVGEMYMRKVCQD